MYYKLYNIYFYLRFQQSHLGKAQIESASTLLLKNEIVKQIRIVYGRERASYGQFEMWIDEQVPKVD